MNYFDVIKEALEIAGYSDQEILEIISDTQFALSNKCVDLDYENISDIEFDYEGYQIIKQALIDASVKENEAINLLNSFLKDSYTFIDGEDGEVDHDIVDSVEEYIKQNGDDSSNYKA